MPLTSIEVKGGAFAADELQMVYGTYSFEGLTAGTEDRTISISIQAVGSDADPVTIDYTLAAGATTVSVSLISMPQATMKLPSPILPISTPSVRL